MNFSKKELAAIYRACSEQAGLNYDRAAIARPEVKQGYINRVEVLELVCAKLRAVGDQDCELTPSKN